MINIPTPLGTVKLTAEYFATLVGDTAIQCYGVSGMATCGPIEGISAFMMRQDRPEKGVRVFARNGKLIIEIHIRVVYGVNISAIVRSISHKVKYAVEEATDLSVMSINVLVDEMVAE